MKERELVKLEIGKEYYCWMTSRVLKLVSISTDNLFHRETIQMQDEYRNDGKIFTWKHSYLSELTSKAIINYKKRLLNDHKFSNAFISIQEDGTFYLFQDECPEALTIEEFKQIYEVVIKGYQNSEE
jgi:hypothetical protein